MTDVITTDVFADRSHKSWCDVCGEQGIFGEDILLVPKEYWKEQTSKLPWKVHFCKKHYWEFLGGKVAEELMR